MGKVEGDERYAFTSSKVIHKVDREGRPDLGGMTFHVVAELEDGYTVYVSPADPSQPNPNYFIHKRYLVEDTSKQ